MTRKRLLITAGLAMLGGIGAGISHELGWPQTSLGFSTRSRHRKFTVAIVGSPYAGNTLTAVVG